MSILSGKLKSLNLSTLVKTNVVKRFLSKKTNRCKSQVLRKARDLPSRSLAYG